MIWSAIMRIAQPCLSPLWLERARIRESRSSLPSFQESALKPRHLYIDLSVISRCDAGTGIQRVVRAIATQLLLDEPEGWSVIPVAATRKRPYRPISWMGRESPAHAEPIRGNRGDVFLGLDYSLDTVRFHEKQLVDFKRTGGQLWFLMHDLLPLTHPHWFSDKNVTRYRTWLYILAKSADGFFCNSRETQKILQTVLNSRYQLCSGYSCHVIPMGWDLASSSPSKGLPAEFNAVLDRLGERPSALMVGTIEPRKGHWGILDAFDVIWGQGKEYNLVIVGRPGWKTESLQTRIKVHPELGKRLFWLDDASDEALVEIYKVSIGVIVASFAEGFGLPLIEALSYGKKILARDVPCFRQHEHFGIRYFQDSAGRNELASEITDWLDQPASNESAGVDPSTWKDSATEIISFLERPKMNVAWQKGKRL